MQRLTPVAYAGRIRVDEREFDISCGRESSEQVELLKDETDSAISDLRQSRFVHFADIHAREAVFA